MRPIRPRRLAKPSPEPKTNYSAAEIEAMLTFLRKRIEEHQRFVKKGHIEWETKMAQYHAGQEACDALMDLLEQYGGEFDLDRVSQNM